MRKKNKKKIDPRYFLHETALREEEDHQANMDLGALTATVHCENPALADMGAEIGRLMQKSGGDERTQDQLRGLPKMARKEQWDFARQAIMHISNYFKKTGLINWDTVQRKANEMCPKGPVHPMTGPDTSSTRWG
jgi:hypothetical protein